MRYPHRPANGIEEIYQKGTLTYFSKHKETLHHGRYLHRSFAHKSNPFIIMGYKTFSFKDKIYGEFIRADEKRK